MCQKHTKRNKNGWVHSIIFTLFYEGIRSIFLDFWSFKKRNVLPFLSSWKPNISMSFDQHSVTPNTQMATKSGRTVTPIGTAAKVRALSALGSTDGEAETAQRLHREENLLFWYENDECCGEHANEESGRVSAGLTWRWWFIQTQQTWRKWERTVMSFNKLPKSIQPQNILNVTVSSYLPNSFFCEA